MKKSLGTILCLASVAVGFYWSSGRWYSLGNASGAHAGGRVNQENQLSEVAPGEFIGDLLYNFDTVVQDSNYGDLAMGGDPSTVTLRQRNYLSDSLQSTQLYVFDASFEVSEMEAVAKDTFYLVGADSQGNTVLELWEKVSLGTVGAVVALDENGSPPTVRSYAMLKTRLYTLPSVCKLLGFEPDLDERFVFVVHKPLDGSPAQLLHIPVPSGPISVVADSTQLSQLETCSEIFSRTHQTLGRAWIIESMVDDPSLYSSDRTLLFDTNNDGVIDYTEELDGSSYASQYRDAGDWVADGVTWF